MINKFIVFFYNMNHNRRFFIFSRKINLKRINCNFSVFEYNLFLISRKYNCISFFSYIHSLV